MHNQEETKKNTILIVDDDRANIFLLEECLSEYNISSAVNSEELFAELEKSIPDIIILDIMMPGLDGFSIVETLKQSRQFSNIPIIFLSALETSGSVAKGLNLGADDYIRKPFNNDELIARIKKVIQNSSKTHELYRKATRDSLTGLHNREYFTEELAVRIQKLKRRTMIFTLGIIDIDHFKNVNDTYGHNTGDIILKKVTMLIQNSLREYDILARYGGEEFIFILDGIPRVTGTVIIDRIRSIVSQTDLDNEHHVFVSFSCGLTDTDEIKNQKDIQGELIKIADRRLYMAKSGGRNRVISEG